MKNTYVKPMATVEGFVANEYVAACYTWNIACSERGHDSKCNKSDGLFHNHRAQYCGTASHQEISIKEDGSFTITEVNTSQGYPLPCTVTGENWEGTAPKLDYSKTAPGTTLYWITSDTRYTYHHKGTVTGTGTPTNHS